MIGDKPVAAISGDDMLDFRERWLERIKEEEPTATSANKDLTHLGDVLTTVGDGWARDIPAQEVRAAQRGLAGGEQPVRLWLGEC